MFGKCIIQMISSKDIVSIYTVLHPMVIMIELMLLTLI